jgi:hypothetical protein
MYFDHSSSDQSGLIPSMSLTVVGRGRRHDLVALHEGEALDLSAASGQAPSAMARISSTMISSPSPRTMTSIQGASLRTCLYMKVAWMPPRT